MITLKEDVLGDVALATKCCVCNHNTASVFSVQGKLVTSCYICGDQQDVDNSTVSNCNDCGETSLTLNTQHCQKCEEEKNITIPTKRIVGSATGVGV